MNRFNSLVYSVLRVLIMPFIKLKFNASFALARPASRSYMVLSNHNTDWDPILVGMSFRRPMSYVTSEHIFRRWYGGIVRFLVKPISRAKGTTEARTALEIIRRLRNGQNVCMFAEGNRSFNGRTCPILPATAKLVKKSGAGLVTYRMDGGYFTSPRWSVSLRRGRLTGRVVREYTAAEIAAMTADEVYEAITRDLAVDAYAVQREHPAAYKGRDLAVGLEHALYMCPGCRRIGRLRSSGDRLSCECGMTVSYDEYGALKGDAPFATVTEWDDWQTAELAAARPAFGDEKQPLTSVGSDHTDRFQGEVDISMDSGALHIGDADYPLSEVANMSIITQNTLVFSTTAKEYFEIDMTGHRSAKKYLDLYTAVRS